MAEHPKGNQWAPFKMREDDPEFDAGHPWSVCLELGGSSGPSLQMWFATESEAEAFIDDEILGAARAPY